MARRKRQHIPLIEIAASALAEKFAVHERVMFGQMRVPAKAIVRMFTPDHIHLHAWGGPDVWWNLDMRRRDSVLKAKDAADTSRAAKAVRIDEKWRPFTAAQAKGTKPRKRKTVWPKRKIRRRK